uniref:EGF-like domain-containing protein n=1 Tax=Chromera velia CCMP2878 TaxID=1169474 RepID=A0A0G4HM71_9ALVE|eukprot:Cvel_7447.t1-p1 / transcript=Cvel_7447.t1 / gene=Cvel_7447 / organism=Chromera_velia_CCMP2878 / gene_product=Probable E3 ubiquitin-protein ligase HERC1, putative / transcript_product=Probable E3 ubiquitin-protein ligase HERC1, putative / location=Cvel_scaffold389:42864-53980(+) / protein_length=1974 / sequence_SO=supercontig / SO=protein_coding / is_pseudo=false
MFLTCSEAAPPTRLIAQGSRHTLALNDEGEVSAFGSNGSGQLGLPEEEDGSVPTKVPGMSHVVDICGGGTSWKGEGFSLVLLRNGTVLSFGVNSSGELGRRDAEVEGEESSQRNWQPRPVEGLEGENVTAVECGVSHSAAVTADGKLFMWGNLRHTHSHREDALPVYRTATLVRSGPLAHENVTQAALGRYHTMIVCESGRAYFFGNKVRAEDGTWTPVELVLEGLQEEERIVSAAAGGRYSLLLTSLGRVLKIRSSWNPNDGYTKLDVPRKVVEVAAGSKHFFIRLEDGRVYSFGGHNSNDYGQLGVGGPASLELHWRDQISQPRLVPQISAQRLWKGGVSMSSSFLVTKGGVYAAGSNWFGELGLGKGSVNKTTSFLPIPALDVDECKLGGCDATASCTNTLGSFSCECPDETSSSGGGALCELGRRDAEVEGEESSQRNWQPRPVEGLEGENVTAVECGVSHSAAVTADGKLFLSGVLLGHPSLSTDPPIHRTATFVRTGPLVYENVTQAALGRYHTMIVCESGRAHFFGNPLVGTSNAPVELVLEGLQEEEKIVSAAVGDHHCLLLTSAGRVFSFTFGRLLDPSYDVWGSRSHPRLVETRGQQAVEVAAGESHAVIRLRDGSIVSIWERLSDDDMENLSPSVAVQRLWKSGAGSDSMVLITSSGLVGAGNNDRGQLGLGGIYGFDVRFFVPLLVTHPCPPQILTFPTNAGVSYRVSKEDDLLQYFPLVSQERGAHERDGGVMVPAEGVHAVHTEFVPAYHPRLFDARKPEEIIARLTDPWSEQNTMTCKFTVQITDEEAPQVFCPPLMTLRQQKGDLPPVVFLEKPPARDNVDSEDELNITFSPPNNSKLDFGTEHVVTVTVKAVDRSERAGFCTFPVIADRCPPNSQRETAEGDCMRREGFYRDPILWNKMHVTDCRRCPAHSTSRVDSKHPSECFCDDGWYFLLALPEHWRQCSLLEALATGCKSSNPKRLCADDALTAFTEGWCEQCPPGADCSWHAQRQRACPRYDRSQSGSSCNDFIAPFTSQLRDKLRKLDDQECPTLSNSNILSLESEGRRSLEHNDTTLKFAHDLLQHLRPFPREGHFLLQRWPEVLVSQCPLKNACIGATTDEKTVRELRACLQNDTCGGLCEENHAGPLCNQCKMGTRMERRSGMLEKSCGQCRDQDYVFLIGALLFLAALLVVFIHVTIASKNYPQLETPVFAVAIKIAMVFVARQMVLAELAGPAFVQLRGEIASAHGLAVRGASGAVGILGRLRMLPSMSSVFSLQCFSFAFFHEALATAPESSQAVTLHLLSLFVPVSVFVAFCTLRFFIIAWPYESPYLNWLETLSVGSWLMTTAIFPFFVSKLVPVFMKVALVYIVALPFLAFVLFAVFVIGGGLGKNCLVKLSSPPARVTRWRRFMAWYGDCVTPVVNRALTCACCCRSRTSEKTCWQRLASFWKRCCAVASHALTCACCCRSRTSEKTRSQRLASFWKSCYAVGSHALTCACCCRSRTSEKTCSQRLASFWKSCYAVASHALTCACCCRSRTSEKTRSQRLASFWKSCISAARDGRGEMEICFERGRTGQVSDNFVVKKRMCFDQEPTGTFSGRSEEVRLFRRTWTEVRELIERVEFALIRAMEKRNLTQRDGDNGSGSLKFPCPPEVAAPFAIRAISLLNRQMQREPRYAQKIIDESFRTTPTAKLSIVRSSLNTEGGVNVRRSSTGTEGGVNVRRSSADIEGGVNVRSCSCADTGGGVNVRRSSADTEGGVNVRSCSSADIEGGVNVRRSSADTEGGVNVRSCSSADIEGGVNVRSSSADTSSGKGDATDTNARSNPLRFVETDKEARRRLLLEWNVCELPEDQSILLTDLLSFESQRAVCCSPSEGADQQGGLLEGTEHREGGDPSRPTADGDSQQREQESNGGFWTDADAKVAETSIWSGLLEGRVDFSGREAAGERVFFVQQVSQRSWGGVAGWCDAQGNSRGCASS